MKSLVVCQKVHLPTTLASLNSGHSSNLCACYVGVRSLSRPNLVPTRPSHLRNAAWQFSLVANLNSITLRRTPTTKAEAHIVAGHCCVAVTTLARNFTWPYNNFVLSRCTSSFSISPSNNLTNSFFGVLSNLMKILKISERLYSSLNCFSANLHQFARRRNPG